MILLRDATRLALTKLKVRIPRYVITVILSSLVFAIVVFTTTIFTGALTSVDRLQDSALAKRYFAKTTILTTDQPYTNSDVVARVERAQADQIAQKKALAQKMGIEYNPTNEVAWVSKQSNGDKTITARNPIVNAIVAEWIHQQPPSSFRYFTDYAKKNGAIATYRFKESSSDSIPYIRALRDGKEDVTQTETATSVQGFSSIKNGINTIDSRLLKDVMLPNQTMVQSPTDGSIPIVTNFSFAEQSLELQMLLPNASPDEKLARAKEVRKNIAGKTFDVCYRNSASAELLRTAVDQNTDRERNKNNSNFVEPDIVYGLPQTACGDITIVKDTRTAERKIADEKQQQFDRQFGAVAPVSRLVTFRVVGIMPDLNTPSPDAIIPLISKFARSTITSGWVIPEDLINLTELEGIVMSQDKETPVTATFIAELGDAETKKKFIDKLSCNSDDCLKQGNYFVFESFGNNANSIYDLKHIFNTLLFVGLLILSIISGLIMTGTIGRIIADSRRETAVFRAIGATRLDMSLVYIIYTLIMACFVIISTMCIGISSALLVSYIYSPVVTPAALLALNTQDYSLSFSFFAINITHILVVIGSILFASLIGMIMPLISNMKRDPIRDMRDDT